MASSNLATLAEGLRDQASHAKIPTPHMHESRVGHGARVPRRPWPDIIAGIPNRRSARWKRDMGDVIQTIPEADICVSLVDVFFREVQGYREESHSSGVEDR